MDPYILFHLPFPTTSVLPLPFFSSSTYPILLLARSAGKRQGTTEVEAELQPHGVEELASNTRRKG
jgi:hypothetical protein